MDSVKAHISNVASLESIIAGSDGQKIANALAKQYREQITDNEQQLEKIGGLKATLYENMIAGILNKDDYKTLKAKYTVNENRLRGALDLLNQQLENALDGSAEHLR